MPELDPHLLSDFEKNLPHHRMILVEGGKFMMGGMDREARENEKPMHEVEISTFYVGKYPVTQALWVEVMGVENNPASFSGEDRPIENVSWDDAQRFIQQLNKLSGNSYRLPTEAEWEYAARGGGYNEGYLYAGSDKLKEVGWYGELNEETHPVGEKLGNELELHDMSGNVWEWCQDRYGSDYYQACSEHGIVKNPQGPSRGSYRVLRGGSWDDLARLCRVSYRLLNSQGNRLSSFGFRLVLSLF